MSTDGLLFAFAHDLRQPLRTIVVQCQRLLRAADQEWTGESRAKLDDIVAAARRQEELIASVVEYEQAGAAGDGGTMALKLAMQSACLKLDALRKQSGGEIRFDAAAAAEVPCGLAKVIEKVLHNSLKFRREGGSPQIEMQSRMLDGRLTLRIADDGPGIEPPYRELVFEPFRRLHPASAYPGSGVGLAICRRLMAGFGGEIRIEDPGPERGLAMLISLPLQ